MERTELRRSREAGERVLRRRIVVDPPHRFDDPRLRPCRGRPHPSGRSGRPGGDSRHSRRDLDRQLLPHGIASRAEVDGGARDPGRQLAERRQPRCAEVTPGGRDPGIGRHPLEEVGGELEGDAAVAGAVFVSAFEAAVRIAQQGGPRREHCAAGRRTVGEASGDDEGDADRRVALLERTIPRVRCADHVVDRPAGSPGDPARARVTGGTRDLTRGEGLVELLTQWAWHGRFDTGSWPVPRHRE
ncbi:MAG: hypothetical protein R2862_02655 [Thermoanaerobaculia bacterium]